ncbi:putative O-glycosylation ligase, exosortase A system-associated, partial [Propionivibrio sp.]|uniref:putative O-glycosylation ligase, exosortase A system-associated n=1 Tax=Propionivibrio sp. TaxID=2212460 RepID=UPI00272DCBC3
MRDLLLTAIVVVLIPLILRTPRYGAYAWAWLSMMNPHRATWGFARNFPFAYTVALSTLIGFLFTKERKPFPVTPITVVYLSFWFWMTFTCLFAMNKPEVVLDRWIFVSKIHLMLMVTLMLIRGREQIEGLVWVVTASIGFYGVKGGVWTVLTGGGSGRVWGPPDSMIKDNNGLALALVVLVPFVYYLYQVSSRRIFRWGLAFSGVAICFSILGSHSRGAFLALIAMAFMLAFKGKRPFLMSFLLVAVLSTAILSMPENWTS